MRMDKLRSSRLRQTGVTLLEMAVVVTVGAVLTVAGFRGAEYLTRSNAAQNIANQAQIGYDVLNNYVAQNVDALVNARPIAGVAVPLAPTPAELVSLGYRNFSIGSTIPNAKWTYSLALSPAGCTANTCNVVVYFGLSAPPVTRGNDADIALIADAAVRSSRPAGWSTNEAPGNIVGIGAQFNIANPQGATPGILGLYGSYGAGQFGNYVRMGDTRDVPLSGRLSVAGNVSTAGNLSVSGSEAIAGNSNVGGSITAAAGRAQLWNQPAEGGVMSLTSADGQRMHQELVQGRTRWINSAWTAEIASISQTGDLNAAGNISTTGSVSSNGTVGAGGAVTAGQGVYALNGKVKIAPTAWAGWGCSDGNGMITTDPNGQVLSCQYGIWKAAGGTGVLTGGGSSSGQGYIYVYPPPGASVTTHKVMVLVTGFHQCDFERAHTNNQAFELPFDGGYYYSVSTFCPSWSGYSYMAVATPR